MSSTKAEIVRLESIVKQNGFLVRYERGSFTSGHCIVNDKKIIIINKFFKPKARIETLKQIIELLNFKESFTETEEYQTESEPMSVV